MNPSLNAYRLRDRTEHAPYQDARWAWEALTIKGCTPRQPGDEDPATQGDRGGELCRMTHACARLHNPFWVMEEKEELLEHRLMALEKGKSFSAYIRELLRSYAKHHRQ